MFKAGVGIGHDCRLLQREFGVAAAGVVPLFDLAEALALPLAGRGLADVVHAALGATLSKAHAVRCSDWAAPLTAEQVPAPSSSLSRPSSRPSPGTSALSAPASFTSSPP